MTVGAVVRDVVFVVLAAAGWGCVFGGVVVFVVRHEWPVMLAAVALGVLLIVLGGIAKNWPELRKGAGK